MNEADTVGTVAFEELKEFPRGFFLRMLPLSMLQIRVDLD
jgi:hypothetical protein